MADNQALNSGKAWRICSCTQTRCWWVRSGQTVSSHTINCSLRNSSDEMLASTTILKPDFRRYMGPIPASNQSRERPSLSAILVAVVILTFFPLLIFCWVEALISIAVAKSFQLPPYLESTMIFILPLNLLLDIFGVTNNRI